MSRSSRPPPCRDLFGPQPHPTTPSAGSDSLRLSFQGGSRPRHLLCCPLCCLNHPGMIHACKFRLESLPLTPPSFHPSPLPVRPQIAPPGPASSTPADQLATAARRPASLHPCGASHTQYNPHSERPGPRPPGTVLLSPLSHGPLRSSAWSHAHFSLLARPQPGRLPEGRGGGSGATGASTAPNAVRV